MTCWSGQHFCNDPSFAQLRISHKLSCPHDRSLESVSGAARRGSTRGAREEEGGIETCRACAEIIVYFWMAGIMSSCEKMSEIVSSAFLAPEGGLWKTKTKQRNQ